MYKRIVESLLILLFFIVSVSVSVNAAESFIVSKPFLQIGDVAKVFSVAIDPSGKYALSSGYNTVLRDLSNNRTIRTFNSGETNQAIFSRDGKYVVTAGNNGKIKFFDVHNGVLIKEVDVGYTSSIDISPDGKYLISGGKNSVKMISIKSKKFVKTYQGHSSHVRSVVFGSNSEYFFR
jgi:WD40 repeat protein